MDTCSETIMNGLSSLFHSILTFFWYFRHNFSEFVKPASSKGISINDISLNSEDLEMYIDLLPYLNPSPYIVPEDMSLTKVTN